MPREESPRKSVRPAPYVVGHVSTPPQVKVHDEIADLEKFYLKKRKPNCLELSDIAEATSLPENFVSRWFAKRRGEEAGMRLCYLDSITRKKNKRIIVWLYVEDFGDESVIEKAEEEAEEYCNRLEAKGKWAEVTFKLFTSEKPAQDPSDQAAALLAAQIESIKLGPVAGRGLDADTEMKQLD